MTGAAARATGERGMILLVVLWTVAVMTVVAVALSAYVQRNLGVAGTEMQQLRSDLAVKSALNAAVAVVWGLKDQDRQLLAGDVRRVALGGGVMAEVTLTEATGRADLNQAGSELLKNLFTAALESEGRGKEMTDAVLSLRSKIAAPAVKPDNKKAKAPDGGSGAGVDQSNNSDSTKAADEKPPEPPPPFQTPLQLQAFDQLDPADIRRVLPLVGVVSRGGKINPLSAPPAVLRAVPKMVDADFATIMTSRKRHDAASENLKAVVGRYADSLSLESSRVFLVSVKIVEGPGLIVGSRGAATILLTPDGAKPFQTLAISW
jgi:general secretion pathway protein K